MLFFSGYNVRMTTDPYEAIKILRDERVHVVVSDQRMPVMQGSELLRIARETRPHHAHPAHRLSDLDASIASVNEGEVFRYLMKPWDAEEVRSSGRSCRDCRGSFAVQLHKSLS